MRIEPPRAKGFEQWQQAPRSRRQRVFDMQWHFGKDRARDQAVALHLAQVQRRAV
jgi:hypothetical protein